MLRHDSIFLLIFRNVAGRCFYVRIRRRCDMRAHTSKFVMLIHLLKQSLIKRSYAHRRSITFFSLFLLFAFSVSSLGNVYSHSSRSCSHHKGHRDRVRGEVYVILHLVFLSVLLNLISKDGKLSRPFLDDRFPSRRHLELSIFPHYCVVPLKIFSKDRKLSLWCALDLRVTIRSFIHRSIFRLRLDKSRLLPFRSRHDFLSRWGAYLSHIFVFELICHH